MSQFTITAVTDMDEWQSKEGAPMITYTVDFEGEQGSGSAGHTRKAASPAPKSGDVLDAELVTKNGKTVLKRIWQENKPQQGGRGKSPGESRQIARMNAQSQALKLLELEIAMGKTFESEKASELLTPRIQFFFDDTKKAGEDA